MRKATTGERGFTLIELLVTVAVLGILAAVAIPQFSGYRARSFNTRALSDLKNMASLQEVHFAVNGEYATRKVDLIGFVQSPGVAITVDFTTENSYEATATHASGDTTYHWDSAAGGLQDPS